MYPIICALKWEVVFKIKRLVIRSDSKTVINQFMKGKVPWYIKTRWLNVLKLMDAVIYCHCFREINFSADLLAKRGAVLNAGERQVHTGRPELVYYIFCIKVV